VTNTVHRDFLFCVGLLLAGAVAGCATPTPEKRGPQSFTILFVGDTSYGENYQEAAAKAGGENILESRGYDDPFRKLDPLLSGSDLVVANLETPITDLERSPLTGKAYIHWSDIDKAPAGLRRHGIEVVSLANNHSMDFGPPGLVQSLAVLADARIESFGAGEDENAAGAPWRRDIRVGDAVFPLRIIGAQDYGSFLEKFSFYARDDAPGVYLLDEKETAERLRSLKRVEPDSFVVVFTHWGENYRWRSRTQQRMAHRLVDAGADLILGHGAHMLQEIEQYDGKWIAYGLGNFMFNSAGRYARFQAPPYSLAAQLIVERENGRWKKTMRFYPIVSNNIKTRYRPRRVTDSEFSEVYETLVRKSDPPTDLNAKVTTARDGIGHYIEIRLD
jgi:hypothetical protein